MKNPIKMMYVRDGVASPATIATEVVENTDGSRELKIAFAFCKTKIENFVKANGRTVALGRLNKQGCYFVTNFTGRSEDDVRRWFNYEISPKLIEVVFPFSWQRKFLDSDEAGFFTTEIVPD